MLPVGDTEFYTAKNILTLNDASVLILDLKNSGKTIGLCHGGFDILHPGHVKHFESAKKLCDFLFVSVTSDHFVGERKGSGRPVFNEKLRAYMIANLKCVDYVIISDFKSALDVISCLKPSLYFKGPDFISKQTPGINAERKAISDVGGEMKYTYDSKLSTTEIINYIKKEIDSKKILLCIDRDGTLIDSQDFLGRESNWSEQIKIKEEVINLILYLQTKYTTTKIVISNQAGVARKLFDCKRVEEINQYIDSLLKERGVKIDDWEYCPDVDSNFAQLKKNEIEFDYNFVKEKTKRKPDYTMVLDSLKKLGKSLEEFDYIIVIGDREEDEGLSKKMKALYINANEGYESTIRKVSLHIKDN